MVEVTKENIVNLYFARANKSGHPPIMKSPFDQNIMAAKGSLDVLNQQIKEELFETKNERHGQNDENCRISCVDCSAKDSQEMTIDQSGSSIPKRR